MVLILGDQLSNVPSFVYVFGALVFVGTIAVCVTAVVFYQRWRRAKQ